jgi:hypothetical protein
MPGSIELRDRLYEAVLELAAIPRSQLDMLLMSPDPVRVSEVLRSLIMGKVVVDERDRMEEEARLSCRRRPT